MLNLELRFVEEGASISSFARTEESLDVIIKTAMNYVGTTNTDDMEQAVNALNVSADVEAKQEWADFSQQGFVEQMLADGSWTENFDTDDADIWTVEIDLDNEFIRFYAFGEFAGSFDFVELDGMAEQDVHNKCADIITNGMTAATKLTVGDCGSVKSSMKQQTSVLEKLLKAIQEGREHPRLLAGVSEEDVAFAEQYCQDMMNAAHTLSIIAENAENILKPLEEAKRKMKTAKQVKKAKTDDTEKKPKKKRTSRKKKEQAPVKIAQTETDADVVEEAAGDGED